MLLGKLIFFVTKTHLMVKRDLLQQIIYFVVFMQTFFYDLKQFSNFMLSGKQIFFVTKTHLMVKRDLLQQIMYFVVKLGPLIQTFFVTQNNCLTLCYWEN